MVFLKTIPGEYYLYGSLGILLLGIILGFTKTITIYRDFADVTKVFMLVLAPIGLYQILGDKVESEIMENILIGILGLILIWLLISTYIDNRNIFKTLLAFITKIPLGVLFGIYLVSLISPGGSSREKRRKSKGFSGVILLFLTPILFGLVKDKRWLSKKK